MELVRSKVPPNAGDMQADLHCEMDRGAAGDVGYIFGHGLERRGPGAEEEQALDGLDGLRTGGERCKGQLGDSRPQELEHCGVPGVASAANDEDGPEEERGLVVAAIRLHGWIKNRKDGGVVFEESERKDLLFTLFLV